MHERGPRSLGLISIAGSLIVLALLIIVALQIYGGGRGQDAETITAPIDRASVLQCRTQVRNCTTAIEMYCAQYGAYPENLDGLDGMTDDMRYCPVNGSPYTYDPETGRIRCPDHP